MPPCPDSKLDVNAFDKNFAITSKKILLLIVKSFSKYKVRSDRSFRMPLQSYNITWDCKIVPQHEGFNSDSECGSFSWDQGFALGYHWCWKTWIWENDNGSNSGNLSILILIREISLLQTLKSGVEVGQLHFDHCFFGPASIRHSLKFWFWYFELNAPATS